MEIQGVRVPKFDLPVLPIKTLKSLREKQGVTLEGEEVGFFKILCRI